MSSPSNQVRLSPGCSESFNRHLFSGLYIPLNCTDVPEAYRGFATRIEDDVLVTDQGCEVLTQSCPKELDDLYRILDRR